MELKIIIENLMNTAKKTISWNLPEKASMGSDKQYNLRAQESTFLWGIIYSSSDSVSKGF